MLTSIVVSSTQIKNIKIKSSKITTKNNAQKIVGKCCFGRRFHDFKYFEDGHHKISFV